MHFTPAQVDEMSLWEFHACCDGVSRANSGNKPEPPSEEEFERAVGMFQ